MRWLTVAVCVGSFVGAAVPSWPQTSAQPAEFLPEAVGIQKNPVLNPFEFIGLRRIAPAAVAAQLSLHPGDPFDAAKLQNDVRRLARLGGFESIRVEELSPPLATSQFPEHGEHMTLIFHLEERPILSRVEYSGSQLLSLKQIEKLLEERKLAPGVGGPVDPAVLQRIAVMVRSSLNELGHPDASVQVHRQAGENATVTARFEIEDGPFLPVRQVRFVDDPRISEKLLRAQMKSIVPWKPLASLRGKNSYSREAFKEDRQRILTYYQDHGYPEARIGDAQVTRLEQRYRRWLPLPRRATRSGLSLAIPVEAGHFYRFETLAASDAIQRAVEQRSGKPFVLPFAGKNHPFSQQEVENLKRFLFAQLQPHDLKTEPSSYRSVEANPVFDAERQTVRVAFDFSDSLPYLVHRLEFRGLHKFSDRYVRRRIPLREGRPVDDRALEVGLTRLARTGYFKPIRKENIHIQFDEVHHTADIAIQLEEIGQQRASLVGGHAQFGSTLGLAYTVFDLLNREELLSARFEGGPESLQIALGIAKEGIFGTRGSLALAVFDNVLRPRFRHSVQGPFFTSRSAGINIPWTDALSDADSISVTYTLSRTTSDYPLGVPPGLTGLPPIDIRSHTSSRTLGTAWAHDTGKERILFSNSASGGVLGGDENMVRTSGEFARIFRDPLFSPPNAWAFRTTFSAAGSYRGNMPFYSRFFSGDEFVRGLRTGELGPLAMTERILPGGATISSPSLAGANLITAANAEYRIPLRSGAEAAAFFDLGSGRLLPNWLGPTKPSLITATNCVLHGSTGLELRWTVPGIQVPLRSYYAFNVLRLDRRIRLADKSFFFASNRFSAFGWGLGSLF